VLEEKVGPVPVIVRAVGGAPIWAQLSVAQLPKEEPAPDRAHITRVLGLSDADLLDEASHQPAVVSCGLPFTIVPLASRDAVARATVDMAVHRQHFGGTSADFIMVFAHDATSGADLHARVFCPGANVPEDPATGSANAALAGYLAKRTPRTGTLRWRTAQGVEMGRPSLLELEADKADGAITAVRVGGGVVWVSEGRMRVS
jgi:trans-2,3-dihydro-3-hydroxyanthranilate isomerase